MEEVVKRCVNSLIIHQASPLMIHAFCMYMLYFNDKNVNAFQTLVSKKYKYMKSPISKQENGKKNGKNKYGKDMSKQFRSRFRNGQ